MKYLMAAICCAYALAGCSSPEEPSASVSIAGPRMANSPDRVPADDRDRSRQAPAIRGGRLDTSWAEYISLQAPADQEYLEDLDRRYFGVVSYQTAEERDYMLRAGFPTPEEWLAAKRMSDAELQERAGSGDPKAAGMLADRMTVRLTELAELSNEEPGTVEDADRARVASMAVAYATEAMHGSQSPFGVYVEGMVKSSIFNSWEPMTAAMLESMDRGDPRVERLILELHSRHPVQDISAIHVALRGMDTGNR